MPLLVMSKSSGRAKCGLCSHTIPKGVPTVRANLGSGRFARTYSLKPHTYTYMDYGTKQEVERRCFGFVEEYADFIIELCEAFQSA